MNQVLFVSSEWADANVLCIGGNAAEYGPHEYNWYDEAAPYLFVSYDGGRSKAFLDCSGGGLTSAGDEAHLEINHIAETSIRVPNVPIVALRSDAGTSNVWSIDAWGAAQTNTGCEWRTDAVGGFTAEMADGEIFIASQVNATGDATVETTSLEKDILPRGTLISALERDEKEQVVRAILYGEMTLIDLHIKEEAYSTDGESYADQIMGVFCKVDFAQQKKDPSTGVL